MSPPRPRNFSLRRIGVGLALLLAGSPGWAAELAVPFKPAVLPERLALHGAGDRHGLIVSAPKDGAVLCDVTHETRFLSTDRNVLTVSTNGVVQAAGDGAAEVLVIWNDQTNRVAVTVSEAATKAAPSFRQEIEPLLTRAGCNMGACHGKLAGQNGFKLSLRGYAPELDYGWLTDDVGGRRINPAFPEESLLVTKPLGTVPHEGKVRFAEGSRYHHTLVDWIAARAPGPVPMELEADASRLEILSGTGFQPVSGASSPSQEHRLEARATGKMPVPLAASRTLRPGETQQFLTRAHWPDGRIRDVTWLAQFFSNDQTVATVTPDGLVKAIRPGETAIRVHFQGLVEVVRVTIPFTNTVDEWKFTRGQNPVDAPVFAKLRALNLPPSPRCDDATFLRRAMLDTLGTLPTPDEVREFVADRSPDKRNKLVMRCSTGRSLPTTGRSNSPTCSRTARSATTTSAARRTCAPSTAGCTGRSPPTARGTSSSARCSPPAATPSAIPRSATTSISSAKSAPPRAMCQTPWRRHSWARASAVPAATIIRWRNTPRTTSITSPRSSTA
jgi:hypothetical protein